MFVYGTFRDYLHIKRVFEKMHVNSKYVISGKVKTPFTLYNRNMIHIDSNKEPYVCKLPMKEPILIHEDYHTIISKNVDFLEHFRIYSESWDFTITKDNKIWFMGYEIGVYEIIGDYQYLFIIPPTRLTFLDNIVFTKSKRIEVYEFMMNHMCIDLNVSLEIHADTIHMCKIESDCDKILEWNELLKNSTIKPDGIKTSGDITYDAGEFINSVHRYYMEYAL